MKPTSNYVRHKNQTRSKHTDCVVSIENIELIPANVLVTGDDKYALNMCR